jgi:hypothetical protein
MDERFARHSERAMEANENQLHHDRIRDCSTFAKLKQWDVLKAKHDRMGYLGEEDRMKVRNWRPS